MNHYNNDVDVCAQCGAMIPSGAPFCPKCGKKNTLANASNQQQNFVAYKPPIQNNVAGNYYQAPVENKPIVNYEVVGAPVPQPVQKQSKTWLVILIVFLVLVAAGIGIFFQELWSSDNHSNNNGVISSRGEYTKGYLNGNVYTNEWADIEFILPDDYNDAASSYYDASENQNTDCGLYIFSEDTTSFMYISYEKLPYSSYSEERYLDSFFKNFKSALNGINMDYSDDYYSYSLADYDYTRADGEFTNQYMTGSFSVCVRKLDDYMIVIYACDNTDLGVDVLLNRITQVK